MDAKEENTTTAPLEIQHILSKNTNLKYLPDKKKIHCTLSGHEMSCDEKIINIYLNGKKYRRLKDLKDNCDFAKYKEHLVDSKKKFHKHQLFCLLTLKHINKEASHIEKHVNGCKFQKALKRWEECKRTGIKYVPISRKQKQRADDGDYLDDSLNNSLDNDDEGNNSDDSLSDLYPNTMICDENGNED